MSLAGAAVADRDDVLPARDVLRAGQLQHQGLVERGDGGESKLVETPEPRELRLLDPALDDPPFPVRQSWSGALLRKAGACAEITIAAIKSAYMQLRGQLMISMHVKTSAESSLIRLATPSAIAAPLVGLITPALALAASTASARLPWDQPLNILVAYLTGPIVHVFIVGSFVGSAMLYALGGSGSDGAKLFARAGLGGAMALGAVRLMNYLLPN